MFYTSLSKLVSVFNLQTRCGEWCWRQHCWCWLSRWHKEACTCPCYSSEGGDAEM